MLHTEFELAYHHVRSFPLSYMRAIVHFHHEINQFHRRDVQLAYSYVWGRNIWANIFIFIFF
jgi:hypothetical protein